ncbi:1-phosphofructokinase family hexose kinase [Kitasatospora sp. A2-31]|uniref:1-phosphofructokinase family hexose kinase n=1 Tax=Kitasatospora sp. A2-31 TaxID=2916414 RepID=UPI001EEDD85A|nr:1-phosphofructokinase family hexose kinase [Kitasatospora sp. A2-31]MCG6499297.1 1-phosphofructokinase family hexose kinase [Kitasatospora sp. A2-31]
MILTVTPNPALDVTYAVPALRPHTTHRVAAVHEQAGGKGVNVARVLHALGRPATALLPLGGPTGDVVRAELDRSGLPYLPVPLRPGAATRRTVTVVDETDATVLNEPGPELADEDWAAVLAGAARLLPAAHALVLAGSLPRGLRPGAYGELVRLAHRHGVPIVLDAGGPALTEALGARPTVVKPNAAELRDATGIADPLAAARALTDGGARAVVASLGPAGVLAVTPDGAWHARLPEDRAVRGGNPTGAGDAVVAALAAALAEGSPWRQTLAHAVALSAAAVRAPYAGHVDRRAYLHDLPLVALRPA